MIHNGMMSINHQLKEDVLFSTFANTKSELQNIRYKKHSVYDEIGRFFDDKIRNSQEYKNGLMIDIFDNTENKTITEFKELLSTKKELINTYEGIVGIIQELYKDIDPYVVAKCCMIKFVFDTYVGLLMEYLIKTALIDYGFIVECNGIYDTAYKIDMLIRHKYSSKMVAIQVKSKTYHRISDNKKDRHLERLNSFKERYKTFKHLELMDIPDIRYILYNEYHHYCSYKGNTLIKADDIKYISGLDTEHNHFGYYGLVYKDTVNIIAEICDIFDLEPPKTYDIVDLPIELQKYL